MAAGITTWGPEQREAVIAAYPRGSEFKQEMIEAFHQGMKHRPDSTLGTFNDDILAFKDPNFRRGDLCSITAAGHKSPPPPHTATQMNGLFILRAKYGSGST